MRVVVAFLLLLLLPSPTEAAKRVALVIGNGSYRHAGELANPRNDATDVAAALKTSGFEVITALDLDKASFDAKIREFAKALSAADAGVFFYAGHGLQVGGKNYLVPVDAQLSTADALEFEMVQLDLVHRIMERQTTTNVIFLDACRNNPLSRNLARAMGTRSAEIGYGLAPVESGVGSLISFSTQPGNVALDGRGRNSPFAGALARRIALSKEDLSALLIEVRKDVMKETQNKQVPWEHSALTGRFYFNGSKEAAETKATPLDAIELQTGAKVVREETAAVEAGGASGSDIFVPRNGLFILDFAVPNGKEIMITMITAEQYQQIATGEKPTGQPLMKDIVTGLGTRSVQLRRGNYFVAFNNKDSTSTQVTYRASFREPLASLKLDERARILEESTIVVPARSGASSIGVAGATLNAAGRGYIAVDWAIAEKHKITLMLSKERPAADGTLKGKPLLKFDIAGPETAGQSAQVTEGTYFVTFINREATPMNLTYRASFVPF